tara:strand:- start:158 stop:454 length:297 start_codon:yes stop_codon:yes gene_type:complete
MTIKFKQNLGKREIITKLTSVIGFSSKNIQKITDDIIEIIISNLIHQKKINLKNLGTFNIIFKNKREGRNPKTKEKFVITSRNSIKFKVSDSLKKKIN